MPHICESKMKLLRKTIRNILQEHKKLDACEKLAVLLTDGTVESAHQAISLGETIGYIESVTHRTKDLNNKFRKRKEHTWHFKADPVLRQYIERQWKIRTFDKPVFNVGYEFDYPKRDFVNIRILENIT